MNKPARLELNNSGAWKILRVLDLFSGIGGFSLGLERAGMKTVAFCEIDPFCRRVLAKHWPGVPIYDDVRNLTAARLRADGIREPDVICGGFPCQDVSVAGAGAGLDGERSGLWREYARLIGDLRPRFAIVENVGALRGRGLAAVLGDVAALRYDAEWHAIPAAAVGAPHLRDRVWIVASARDADSDDGRSRRSRRSDSAATRQCVAERSLQSVAADADSEPGRQQRTHGAVAEHGTDALRARQAQPRRLGGVERRRPAPVAGSQRRPGLRGLFGPLARALAAASAPWQRTAEPPLRGVDDGIPARLDRPRVRALGNAVVPQIPEMIGRAILEAE